jgi:hypothetical protein
MYQKDFILRMIEMLGDLIAGILGLIKKGHFEQASHALENAYYDFLKKDAAFFRLLPKEKLTNDLIKEHNYTNGHLDMLSELFYTEGELLFAKGKRGQSMEFYEKALILFDFIDKESKTFSFDKKSRIELVQNRIAQLKGQS